MSTTSTVFETPTQQQVKQWYDWALSLNHMKNPFHPTNGSQFWDVKNNNEAIIWLAGVTATTEPANKPSNIPNLIAIEAGSAAKAVYDGGEGVPTQKLASIAPRDINIEGDSRSLYCPVSTELATATKYPNFKGATLSELAEKIIDREDVKGNPPAFVEFEDALGNKYTLNGNQLKTGFRVNGSIGQISVPEDNIFMLPAGSGDAAQSDYVVMLKREALKSGNNTLKFGVNGKFFSYTVVYTINA